MLPKSCKRTPRRSIKDRRRRGNSPHSNRKRKTPSKVASSALLSINKTLFACSRKLNKIFSELTSFNTTIRYKGYRNLKTQDDDDDKTRCEEKISTGTCKVLPFTDNSKLKLPPSLSMWKRTIFLDLDETLVHSTPHPPPTTYDFIVNPKIDGVLMRFYVLKRPGVDEFLTDLAEKYEVVVFTAGLKEYASLVLDKLDPNGVISHRLYRDSSKEVDGKFVKDLSEMGRELKGVVIIDDNPNCYVYQPDNAVPIIPFIDDLGDAELGKLGNFLQVCDCYEDMRDAVKVYLCDG